MSDNIYFSLDEARKELKKRRNDLELREKIEKELGEKFLPPFRKGPRAVLNRQVASPDNGFVFFCHCAKYIGAEPLAWEDDEDIFVSLNEEKKGLGRLRVTLEDGTRATVDIMNFHENEKKNLGECVLKTGEKLVDFHHGLFKSCQYDVERYDNPEWIGNLEDVSHYYYLTFLHFLAHGALFEVFFDGDSFTNDIVLPNIERIKKEFGVSPIIVRLYPDEQTDEEDFYWWSYPPSVNGRIIKYAEEKNLKFRQVD
ncbi:MAG: hypothetical protein AB1325_13610 [Nitrospirota bacterium]